jgi:5'-nucleotidase
VLALITNDDGIASPGIRTLTRAALDTGLAVIVAAPSWDSSGASASLTSVEQDGRLLLEPWVLEGLEDVDAYAVRPRRRSSCAPPPPVRSEKLPTSCCRA